MVAPVKGWRFCSVRCAREDRANAMLVLARYGFVGSVRETDDVVSFEIDLMALATINDGPSAEAMVMRDVEKAIALHAS
jgi:hypothetical protein